MNFKITRLIFISTLFMAFSCDFSTESEDALGKCKGTVYDNSTGNPLDGVSIFTEPSTSSKITGQDGAFELSDIENGTYTLYATKTGYENSQTSFTISDGSTAQADIQLSPLIAQISVSVSSLDFSAETNSLVFEIANQTAETSLEWEASTNAEWLAISPDNGVVSSSSDAVVVSVDRAGLDPGIYTDYISISSNGGSKSIAVSMEVDGPELVLSSTSINLGTSDANYSFTISNANGADHTLYYAISKTQGWLTLSPTDGSVTTEIDVINLSVDRSGLDPGNYTDIITISTNANSETISVLMSIADPDNPQLSVFPTSLVFDSDDESKNIIITNTGTGELSWNIYDDQDWISISPSEGTTSSESDQVAVSVNRYGFESGSYTGTITVNAGDAGISTANVVMNISEQPSLAVSSDELDFGEELSLLTFDISNAGSGSLVWSIDSSCEWLSISPSSGSGYSTINVIADRSYFSNPGQSYTCDITVSSNGGTDMVQASISIPADNAPVDFVLEDPYDITSTTISLQWERNFELDFASYKVYRATTAAVTQSSELVAEITSQSQNSYTDTGLSQSTDYYYRVYVMDLSSQHTGSNIVSGRTLSELGNWSIVDNFNCTLKAVDFLNENLGVAVGTCNDVFWWDGSEWEVEEDVLQSIYNYAVKIVSPTEIYVGGYEINKYNGVSWQEAYDPNYTVYAIEGTTDNIWCSASSGRMYGYDGDDWDELNFASTYNIRDMHMLAEDEIWAVNERGNIYLYNGVGWSVQQENNLASLYSIYVENSNSIWLSGFTFWNDEDNCGYNEDYSRASILRYNGTELCGKLFTNNNIKFTSSGSSSSDIWFAGEEGLIWHWNGYDMEEAQSPVSSDINSIKMVSSTDGWAVTNDGTILRYK